MPVDGIRSLDAQSTGTACFYRRNRQCPITDGAKYLADEAGAYWLLDAAVSYLSELRTYDWFVLIRLAVFEHQAVLSLSTFDH